MVASGGSPRLRRKREGTEEPSMSAFFKWRRDAAPLGTGGGLLDGMEGWPTPLCCKHCGEQASFVSALVAIDGTRQNLMAVSYRFVPFCSMKVRASITVRKPPREPSMLVSLLEKSGRRRDEKAAGSKAPRLVWNTQTYS